jgi:hypothetical protein
VEYDGVVKRLNQALVAAFVLVLTLAVPAGAQIHGAPPSVTSMGFGGHATGGVSPSVTSLGPRGYTPGFNPAFPNSRPWRGVVPSPPVTGQHPHHHPRNGAGYAYPYYYGGYYVSPEYANDNPPEEEEYNGGPTIFDRRGSGTLAPLPEETSHEREPGPASTQPVSEAGPETDQPQTVLVFKDGHQAEIQNYAIVGDTLYDLTDGRRRKIALADLDLTATVNQNDDRGVDFQVPASAQMN